MLEARLPEAGLLKRVLDSISALITDANFDCDSEGIRVQAMDNSHVALSAVELRSDGFDPYRSDRPMTIGVSLASLAKIVKSGNNDDILTLRKEDQGDTLTLVFESAKTDRIAEYDMKLMDIDSETLGIPDCDYDAHVTMSSSEFVRLTRDLSNIGDAVSIAVDKNGVTFATDGEIGKAQLTLKQGGGAGNTGGIKKGKPEPVDDEDEEMEEEEEEDVKPAKKAKKEEVVEVDADEDEEEEDVKPTASKKEEVDDEDEDEIKPAKKRRRAADAEEEDEEEQEDTKKSSSSRGKAKTNGKAASSSSAKGKGKGKGRGKKAAGGDDDFAGGAADVPVQIELTQSVHLTFSLKYLSNFAKAAPLSPSVSLKLSKDYPLLVEFAFESGHVRFYLAPKLGDEDEEEQE